MINERLGVTIKIAPSPFFNERLDLNDLSNLSKTAKIANSLNFNFSSFLVFH